MKSYLANRVGSTSESPADGLTNKEPNCCRCPVSSAWLMSDTADSISTATNSSSCCSSPWWRQTTGQIGVTAFYHQVEAVSLRQVSCYSGECVPVDSASAAAAALGGKEPRQMETLEAAGGPTPSDS